MKVRRYPTNEKVQSSGEAGGGKNGGKFSRDTDLSGKKLHTKQTPGIAEIPDARRSAELQKKNRELKAILADSRLKKCALKIFRAQKQ
jgi:hypothetical protein